MSFFDELGELGTDIWHGAERGTKWLLKDMPQEIIDAPGRVNDELSRGLNKMGVRGWVGDNPLEAVAAAVGTYIAGPYVASAIGGSGASAGGGAPVIEAVGQSPLDAILSGGGSASELGSVSTSGVWNERLGKIAMDLGSELFKSSSQPGGGTTTTQWQGRSSTHAPAFQPVERPVIKGMMVNEAQTSGQLNLDPFGFQQQ